MTILYFTLLIVALLILHFKGKSNDDSFWRNLFKVVTLKITDYYCKDTPTKAVMAFMKFVGILYEGSALSYPIIRAVVNQNAEMGFWSLFLEFQWDTVSSTMTYVFIGCVALVLISYFICYRNEKRLDKTLEEVKDGNDKIQFGIENIDNNLQRVLSSLKNGDYNITKHLLFDLKDSIETLHVKTAFQYLSTIWKELKISKKEDFELQASIQYLMGECARYVKDLDSKEYHGNAYNFMKRGQFQDDGIIEGMIYETCRRRDFKAAKQYVNELTKVGSSNPWCHVPTLMEADSLRQTFENLPDDNSKMTALGLCIMMGGGKSHDLGVDIESYSYNELSNLTTANFPLWIMDLSVATTLFCQNLVVYGDIKRMSNEYSKKVFKLTDHFLSLLNNTEIENILPDTVFLHAVTGYFDDQDDKWLDVLKDTKPSEGMKELFHLTYAIILNNASDYESAKRLLNQYNGGNIASILNMRCIIATQNNDYQECIEVIKYSSKNHVVIPDHLANFFFSTVHYSYDSVKDEAQNIEFEKDITKRAYSIFLDYISGKEVDVTFIVSNKDKFHITIIPYMAMVAKDKISLSLAIYMLEKCADPNVLDLRSVMLIDLYLKESVYNQKLYHLLKELRNAGIHDVKNLSIELNMSNDIQDFDNSLEITRILIQLLPDDEGAIVNHLLALSKCGGNEEEIKSYKEKVLNKEFSVNNTRYLFNLYHIIGETPFAVEFLYKQIEHTNNQELKDLFFSMHLNPEIDKIISVEKDTVEIGDYVTIDINGEKKDILITPGSVYEDLCGCKIEEKKSITMKEDVEVTISEIRTKYNKLLRDILKEIGDSGSSKSIKMFNLNDFDFQNDPLGALQKIVGRTEDSRAKEQALLEQYRQGEMSLLGFIKGHEFFSNMYDKIFGDFMVCTFPKEYFSQLLNGNEVWKQKELVLDISSVIILHEFDKKFGLPDGITFNVPKAIESVLKEQIINEEKGMPVFFAQRIVDRISIEIIDESKTTLWNKLKSIEDWINKRCVVQTVEEVINLNLRNGDNLCSRAEAESLLLSHRGMLLLSEDWYLSKNFAAMSCYNWLSLMGINDADKWGKIMLECGNVGYPMTSDYIRSQYDLMANSLPNNYQGCLENIKYHLLSWKEVVCTAKGLLSGVVEPTKILGATNMMTILFQNMNDQMCRLIIQREFIGSQDKIWHQCLIDALKISHPLILPQ